ncbi:MAG: COX15/CtaA family protein [Caulobacterales bacterium]
MTSFLKDGRSRPVALWLFSVAVLVFVLVVVGGVTRLTGSGLSITEWRPVTGVAPPLSPAAWRKAFDLYRATPQYRHVNVGMSLGAFQAIYWWEWTHRLLARLVGVAFAVPMLIFLATRSLPGRLIWRCVMLLGLGGLQAFVGWWMVQSGLEDRVSVAPERLATHLALALFVFCALLWTGMEAWSGLARQRAKLHDGWRAVTIAFAAAVFLQCMLGALVAGNHAGLVDNDWPLMNGQLFPSDYAGQSFWATIAHSQAAEQFNHRILAYLLVIVGVGIASAGLQSRDLMGQSRGLCLALGVIVVVQASMGILTLVTGAPLALAMAHQAGAAILLATATALAWRVRRA